MYAARASGVFSSVVFKLLMSGRATSRIESVQVQFLPAVSVCALSKLTSRVALGSKDVKAVLLYGGYEVLP